MTQSSQRSPADGVDYVDSETVAIYLEVPGSKIVLLQGYFELYEGVGIVRTVDVRRSLLCILTTPSMVDDCLAVLDAISEQIPWRPAPLPEQADRERYLGYFKKGL